MAAFMLSISNACRPVPVKWDEGKTNGGINSPVKGNVSRELNLGRDKG